MEMYSHPDIQEILTLPGNSNCCDCNAEKPKWSSLTNGIFLCLKCAGIHRSLGVEISTIRSLQIDSWTDKQILYLSKGGNNKFKQMLSEYRIDPNSQTELKYKSKAADYYRKCLKNEVEKAQDKNYQQQEIIKPSLEEGKELIDIKKGNQEVNNSKLIGQFNEPKKEEEGILSVFGSFLNNVKETAGGMADKISKGIEDMKIKEKLKEAGDAMADYAKAGSDFIMDKSQKVINSEFVQDIAKTAESGINIVIEKTKVLLNNDKNNNQQNVNPNNNMQNENNLNQINEDNIQMSSIIENNNNNNPNNINLINENINNEGNQKAEEKVKDEKINEDKEKEIENKSNSEQTNKNIIDNKKIEEESVRHDPESPSPLLKFDNSI